MLSPSNSLETPPESQQQQKRVKEEEGERELGVCVEKASVEEKQARPATVCPSAAGVAPPSFPSLLPSTCNSWCYLNYTKPSPRALDKHRPSVYSSWSTAGYDPNPPGLSSKTALSLLSCKQRLSPSIYTTSPMSEPVEQEDTKRPRGEVISTRIRERGRKSVCVCVRPGQTGAVPAVAARGSHRVQL